MIETLKEFWEWAVIVSFIVIVFIRTKSRGFFWKARDGSELTLREFFQRWGKGIEGITPLQQSRSQLWGIWIVVTGIISGLVINLLVRLENQWYWISVILAGSLIITIVNMIGTYQKYRIQKRVEQTIKELNMEQGVE